MGFDIGRNFYAFLGFSNSNGFIWEREPGSPLNTPMVGQLGPTSQKPGKVGGNFIGYHWSCRGLMANFFAIPTNKYYLRSILWYFSVYSSDFGQCQMAGFIPK